MFQSLRVIGLSLAAVVAASAPACAFPTLVDRPSSVPAVAMPVDCEDCWHSRWRSHYRFGSYNFYYHSRWRSHYRLGSYGGCADGGCGWEGGEGADWTYRPWGYRYRYE